MNILSNPGVLFILIWGCILSLYSWQALSIYEPPKTEALFIVFVNVFLAIMLSIVFRAHKKRDFVELSRSYLQLHIKRISKFVNILLLIYIVILLLDVYYSRGIPIVWALTGDAKTYVDYGIPTIHGLSNSICFFLSSFLLAMTLLNVRKYWLVLFLLFAYQLSILSRGTIIVMVVQMLCVFLFFYRVSFIQKTLLGVFIFGFIVLFGILGDLRQGGNPYYGFLVPEWQSFFETMPSGFMWFYVYFTSGFNNFSYNTEIVEPLYLPIYTFAKLLPSVFYSIMGIEKAVDAYEFVNNGLNVSTIYSAFYTDFGVFSFLLVGIIQLIASIYYYKAKQGNFIAFLCYAVAFQAIFLSFFIDTFFYLPFLFQFLIIYFLKGYLGEKKS